MATLSNEDLEAVRKIVRRQLDELRDTQAGIRKAGLMTGTLEVAIFTECDRLNMLEDRIIGAKSESEE